MNEQTTTRRSMYEEDGFVIFEDLLDPDLVEEAVAACLDVDRQAAETRFSGNGIILEAPEGGWRAKTGRRPGYRGVIRSIDFVDRLSPFFRALPTRSRLEERCIRPLVDRPTYLINSIYWAKPPHVGSPKPWHQDMAYAPAGFLDDHVNVVSLWIAFDPARADNGCLEFIPGSHRLGTIDHVGVPEPESDDDIEAQLDCDVELPGRERVTVELLPGSAVAFDGYTAHRSGENRSALPRRAISYVYALPR